MGDIRNNHYVLININDEQEIIKNGRKIEFSSGNTKAVVYLDEGSACFAYNRTDKTLEAFTNALEDIANKSENITGRADLESIVNIIEKWKEDIKSIKSVALEEVIEKLKKIIESEDLEEIIKNKALEEVIKKDTQKVFADFETSYSFFKSIMQKMYIIHALCYGKGMSVNSISFLYKRKNNQPYMLSMDSKNKDYVKMGFPFVVSAISGNPFELSEDFKDLDKIVVAKKNSDILTYKSMVSLCSYLQSKNRKQDIDRLLNLWTAMNAFYGELVDRFNRKTSALFERVRCDERISWCEAFDVNGQKVKVADYLLIKEEVDSQGLNLMKKIYSDKLSLCQQVTGKKFSDTDSGFIALIYSNYMDIMDKKDIELLGDDANRTDIFNEAAEYEYDSVNNKLNISYSDLYEKVLAYSQSQGDESIFEGKYSKVLEWSKHFKENLYLLILINLSYYLRCEFVHGSLNNLVTYDSKGKMIKVVALANYFMDRFLSDNLPELIKTDEMDDETYKECRKWLADSRKNNKNYNSPKGFLMFLNGIVEEYIKNE